MNPVRDGIVLPILHLNGYKIANPTVLARIGRDELDDLLKGYGYEPFYVEGDEPEAMHQLMAATLDEVFASIKAIQTDARENGFTQRPMYPMIVLRSPKGWTGPKFVDGLAEENSFRSHQVPLDKLATNPEHLRQLEEWMRSYNPEELFDENGKFIAELAELAPLGNKANERESARERRTAFERFIDAEFLRLRGRSSQTRHDRTPKRRA